MNQHADSPIAVVGVAAIMPDAPDAGSFWQNLRDGRYSVSDVPTERWDPELYYDPDPAATDKTYSRIGGWVREHPWEPQQWRLPIPPTVAAQFDIGQQWAVSAARSALLDAGWPQWDVDPERVAVIIGNAIGGEKHYRTSLRVQFPEFARDLRASSSFTALPAQTRTAILEEWHERFLAHEPPITEDTMPGELSNVLAGRVANLFDLRGPNFTTDAACASALAATSAAAHGLVNHEYDAVITGGIDRNMGVYAFVKFCKIGALSATGTRPFDAGADGFVMGEGAALFVLKRLADAERDGDRVYAVLLGLGGASDGKGKGITAPNPVGQRLAVERAWADAGLKPGAASAVEAHGTSTRVGDAVELDSLGEVFGRSGVESGSIALGSVKSNIGHLKAAAGAAGLFKMVMQLHERVLVPSLGFHDPNPNVDWTHLPFSVTGELRDWPVDLDGARRAGVSAFGFGGTNFHAVLEEYVPGLHRDESAPRAFASADVPAAHEPSAPERESSTGPAPAPLRGAVVLGGRDDAELLAQLEKLAADAADGTMPPSAAPTPDIAHAAVRIALDYADAADLAAKAGKAVTAFRSESAALWKMLRAQGVFLGRGPAPKVAFLYTGQGSQYVNMLKDLRAEVPVVADTFAEADRIMTPVLGRPLTSYIFIDESDPDAVRALEQELTRTEITQPAILTTDLALTRLLGSYGIDPDMVMGHSLGEYAALVAAGAMTFEAAMEAVSARGQEMASISVADNGALAAVFGPLEEIERVVASIDSGVVVANINSLSQAVIGGPTEAVGRAVETFLAEGINAIRIPVSHAFHTSIVAPASTPLKQALRRLDLRCPVLPVVSNVTGDFYPTAADRETMVDLLGRQVASPVQFVRGLRTLYDAGARVFVEVGPKKALHGFVEDVLREHDDVLALFTNHPKNGDLAAVNAALCGLWAAGLGRAGAPSTSTPETGSTMTDTLTTDTYVELGHLFASVLEQGLQVTGGGTPVPPAPALPEPVVITGAALGLPGVPQVFDDANLQRILDGQQFIDTIPHEFRRQQADMHVTRLVKRADGDPTFEAIDDEADVVKLAGRHAPLDVVEQFGIDPARDSALDSVTRLAIGAGFDAMRDAGLPLVMRYKTTSLGSELPERWGLPDALRDDTGVIFASAFPGYTSFAHDLRCYYTDRGRREQLLALEAVRSRMRGDEPGCAETERRIAELRRLLECEPFAFDRRFLFRALSMGHSQFAEIIGARGPNTQVNAACASTTLALSLAEDWIRAGRCRRVVVVSADDATSDELLPWVTAGFLASGAAATDESIEDAAIPFDRRRHGMIVGMGAASFVVESAEAARERGLQPICEVLGAVTGNSAFHGTRLDVDHIAQMMESVVAQAERRGVDRHEIARSTVFVSHETYTPARGGSASAEINALRATFGTDADSIVIANTKGFTGHAMGAGIEDVVAVKALETGLVPPVPNFKEPDPELGELNLSQGGAYPVRHALRLAAGFGSQVAMSLLRWTPLPDGLHRSPGELGYAYRITDPEAWQHWLDGLGGEPGASLEVDSRRLRVVDRSAASTEQAAEQAPEPVAEPAPVAVEVAAGPSPEEATEAVVSIVAQMTGYPPELLELDLDLEADLGVDTVKQAEVFAAVRERFGLERDESLSLRDFPTLTHVIGWVRDQTTSTTPTAPAPATAPATAPIATGLHLTTVVGDLAAVDALPRREPVPVLRPALDRCVPTGVVLGPDTRVVVMPDQGGVAELLQARLSGRGVTVLPLDPARSSEQILSTLEAWRSEGDIAGVYWLPALDDEGPLDALSLADVQEALRRRVKALYTVMRRLYDDRAFLVAGTRHGGFHGYDAAGATAPLGGAVTGFAKSYKRERPEALVKTVDLSPAARPEAVADLLVAETTRDPGCVEVGYADGQRWSIGLSTRPFPPPGSTEEGTTRLGHDSVVLVTGAAGSIVAAVTADLARAAGGGTFHLLDLTPEPDPADPDLRQYVGDREAFKALLATRMKERGERPTPVAIEKELALFERRAAALTAIDAVRDAGGTVHYHSVDLTDAASVARVLERVRESSDHIDLLVHAAGIEVSRALPDKEPHEFDLVYGVKADGWFNVMKAAGDLPIGATVVFSSVAGRFGNAGQCDYGAANDLLCRITSNLRRTRPETRGIAVDWTAWGGIGMATRGSIPRIMEMAGVQLLPPEAGVAWIRRELTGHAFRGEVVAAGELGRLADGYHPTGGVEPANLAAWGSEFAGEVVEANLLDGLVVQTTLDPVTQPFLNDHRIDGTAVLPGVMGMELFAEVARVLAPDRHVVAVENVDFVVPVKFYRDEPRTLTVTARIRPEGPDLVAECRLEAERMLPGNEAPQRTVHFTGSVRLSAKRATCDRATPVAKTQGAAVIAPSDVYRLYFHGPAYQVVGEAWRGDGAAVGRLAEHLPADHEPATTPTLLEPRLEELCFQVAGLWEAGREGRLALPSHVDRLSLLGDVARGGASLVAIARPASGGEGVFDCEVLDPDGRVLLRLDGYHTVPMPGPLTDDVRAPLRTVLA
jgi:acyl transferase domain-containing protein/NAD(P)-dependent dehydrogenase (short-subunit alcohol dehydrogenase family)